MEWNKKFKIDPIPVLLNSKNEALIYFTKKELQGLRVGPIKKIWELPEVEIILRKQQKGGLWKYPTKKNTAWSQRNYDFLETYRQIRYLIDMYGLDNRHKAIRDAAKFLLSFQSKEGDLRGIYGNQQSPNYSAAVFELLIKAGYKDDKSIMTGLDWLLDIRQDDGGWALAFRTKKSNLGPIFNPRAKTLQSDRTKPFSHLITDPALRALSTHPIYRKRKETIKAGELLKSRFFKPDKYPDHKDKKYWTKLRFPYFAYCDLLSSLESLHRIGFKKEDPEIKKGLDWFVKNQRKDGTWKRYYESKRYRAELWITFAVAKLFKKFYKK
jgi:squalene cyclase